jgi:hypothetical protein
LKQQPQTVFIVFRLPTQASITFHRECDGFLPTAFVNVRCNMGFSRAFKNRRSVFTVGQPELIPDFVPVGIYWW